MAFYNDPNLEEENLNGNQPSSNQSGVLSAGTPGGASSSNKPDNPGNFVGISQYLNANKNQANEFGGQVAGKISDTINTAQNNIGGFQNSFKGEADKGLINNFGGAKDEATGIVNKASTGALDALPNEQEKGRFGEIANAQYKGPKNAQDVEAYNPVYQSVQDAQKLADLSKNESGSQELVKGFADKDKQYTSGANRLDSYLLNTQENKQRLQDARKNAELLKPSFDTAVSGANEYATGLQDKTNTLKNDVRSLFSNTAMGKRASVQDQLAQQQKEVESANALRNEYAALFGDTSDGGNLALTPEQMSYLGLTEGQQLYGALNKEPSYYLPQQQVFDPNSAIAKEDQARLSALQGLAGTYGGDFTNPYTQANLAGTASYEKLDGSKLKAEAERLGKEYQKQYSSDKTAGGSINMASKAPYDIAKKFGAFNGLPPINQATPAQLENEFLPRLNAYMDWDPRVPQLKSQILGALSSWKNRMHSSDKVTKK